MLPAVYCWCGWGGTAHFIMWCLFSGSTSSWVLDWCPGCFWGGEYMCTERSIYRDLQRGWWLLVPECLHSQGQRLHRCQKWSQI